MPRPSPLLPCRRAFPCSPPFIALRNAHPRYVRIHPAGTALLARPGCPTLTGCGNFGAPVSGSFDGLTRSGLGRTSPFRDEGGKGLESERRARYPASPKGRVTRGKRSFTLAAGPSAHAPLRTSPG